jgi:hypothetical protein
MYKYGLRNIYIDGEYIQNILFKKSEPNINNNNNFKSHHVFLS